MSLTYEQARGETFEAFRDAWTGGGFALSNVAWPDLEFTIPAGNVPWARVSFDIVTSGQDGFGIGTRKFRRSGLLAVQLFTPLGGGSTDAMNLAKIVTDAFEGQRTAGGVWFRSISGPTSVGASGGFNQTNLAVAFEYDEIK